MHQSPNPCHAQTEGQRSEASPSEGALKSQGGLDGKGEVAKMAAMQTRSAATESLISREPFLVPPSEATSVALSSELTVTQRSSELMPSGANAVSDALLKLDAVPLSDVTEVEGHPLPAGSEFTARSTLPSQNALLTSSLSPVQISPSPQLTPKSPPAQQSLFLTPGVNRPASAVSFPRTPLSSPSGLREGGQPRRASLQVGGVSGSGRAADSRRQLSLGLGDVTMHGGVAMQGGVAIQAVQTGSADIDYVLYRCSAIVPANASRPLGPDNSLQPNLDISSRTPNPGNSLRPDPILSLQRDSEAGTTQPLMLSNRRPSLQINSRPDPNNVDTLLRPDPDKISACVRRNSDDSSNRSRTAQDCCFAANCASLSGVRQEDRSNIGQPMRARLLTSGSDSADDPLRLYAELASHGELHSVELRLDSRTEPPRRRRRLGLRLVGHKDPATMGVFVGGVLGDTPAAADGRVWVGDQLIQVNDKVLFGHSHLNVTPIFKELQLSGVTRLRLLLLRRADYAKVMAMPVGLKNDQVVFKTDPSTLCWQRTFSAPNHPAPEPPPPEPSPLGTFAPSSECLSEVRTPTPPQESQTNQTAQRNMGTLPVSEPSYEDNTAAATLGLGTTFDFDPELERRANKGIESAEEEEGRLGKVASSQSTARSGERVEMRAEEGLQEIVEEGTEVPVPMDGLPASHSNVKTNASVDTLSSGCVSQPDSISPDTQLDRAPPSGSQHVLEIGQHLAIAQEISAQLDDTKLASDRRPLDVRPALTDDLGHSDVAQTWASTATSDDVARLCCDSYITVGTSDDTSIACEDDTRLSQSVSFNGEHVEAEVSGAKSSTLVCGGIILTNDNSAGASQHDEQGLLADNIDRINGNGENDSVAVAQIHRHITAVHSLPCAVETNEANSSPILNSFNPDHTPLPNSTNSTCDVSQHDNGNAVKGASQRHTSELPCSPTTPHNGFTEATPLSVNSQSDSATPTPPSAGMDSSSLAPVAKEVTPGQSNSLSAVAAGGPSEREKKKHGKLKVPRSERRCNSIDNSGHTNQNETGHASHSRHTDSSHASSHTGHAHSHSKRQSTSSTCMEDPRVCHVEAGRETYIEIHKSGRKDALGLELVGGIHSVLGLLMVHEIYEDGAAARDGRLCTGDQILEVNGEDWRDVTDEWANESLRHAPGPLVRLLVYREPEPLAEDELYDVFYLDLLKKPGRGLGLSITGRAGGAPGIFISDVIKGGVADVDGQLMAGDRVLVVNGVDVREAPQQQAAELLKTLMGRVSLTIGRVKLLSRSTSRDSSRSEVDTDEEVQAYLDDRCKA